MNENSIHIRKTHMFLMMGLNSRRMLYALYEDETISTTNTD